MTEETQSDIEEVEKTQNTDQDVYGPPVSLYEEHKKQTAGEGSLAKAESTKPGFTEAAKQKDKEYMTVALGELLTDAPQMQISDAIMLLFDKILSLFDPESPFAIIEADRMRREKALGTDYNEANQPDAPIIVEKGVKASPITTMINKNREVMNTPDHPMRNSTVGEYVKDIVDHGYSKFDGDVDYGQLDFVEDNLNKLLDVIEEYESSGKDNVVWDYRNRTQPGEGPGYKGSWPGHEPGDVTPGGLKVPKFTELTNNDVIAWGRQYLNEQYNFAGLKKGTGSSATGTYQFTSSTLKEMRNAGLIDGNALFGNSQRTNAVTRMVETRNLDDYLTGKISKAHFMKDLGNEWEAFHPRFMRDEDGKTKRAIKLENALDELKEAYKQGPQTEKLADAGTTAEQVIPPPGNSTP